PRTKKEDDLIFLDGNLGSVVTDKTIDSQYLLEMVNQARKQCGEKEVRNNDFIYLRINPRPIGWGYKGHLLSCFKFFVSQSSLQKRSEIY
ncbi:hypothetical protein AU825_17805, partial [Salmonella enterica subsp. salamae]|nr:hypothetical protein [Salmonella enterica subsp. salamae]ECF6093066.1 hypothetical protein [Salmonella enterica subsp. salamae]EDW5992511.1 hypothetical protein [Salmonella enterica subsp. salamae]